ncbi:MAG: GNAT family N-acetyltransferase [Anaerolineales bacterium]|jgi:RimJ/RimL family protein N-acetyltransferase
MIQGGKIALRPVERDDLAQLEHWKSDPELLGEFNVFGLHGRQGREEQFAKDGLLNADRGQLLVVDSGGEVVGMASYWRVDHGPRNGGHAYQIGTHLAPDRRGQGLGVEVAALLAGYLFETYPVQRVEAETDVENSAAQRALEKAGFTREGVLRAAQWRAGGWHDLVMYSVLRGE